MRELGLPAETVLINLRKMVRKILDSFRIPKVKTKSRVSSQGWKNFDI